MCEALRRQADFQTSLTHHLTDALQTGQMPELTARSNDDELMPLLNGLFTRLQHISAMSNAIADGNLTALPPLDTIGGESEKQIGRMIATLEGLIAKARNSTNQILRAGSQIHSITLQGAQDTKVVTSQINEISQSIHHMATHIQRVAEHVRDQSNRLGESSSSIEHTMQSVENIAENIESLKAIVEKNLPSALASDQTALSLDLLDEATQAISKDANLCVQCSQEASEHAEHGKIAVQHTMTGIHAIQTAMQTFFGIIKRLGERAEEVNEILEVMTDIADHTNLLAINAAIISAHAGDQGRDFAVIADEIGKFVERTRESTNEIGDLLRTIQTEVTEATHAMDNSSKAVTAGVEYSAQAGTALENIAASIVNTRSMITRIVGATSDQTRENERIRGIMRELVQTQADTQTQLITLLAHLSQTIGQIRGITSEQAEGSARLAVMADNINRVIQEIEQATDQYTTTAAQIIEAVNYIHKLVHRTTIGTEKAIQLTDEVFTQGENLALTMGEFVLSGRPLPDPNAEQPTIGVAMRSGAKFFDQIGRGIRHEAERYGFRIIETNAAYEASRQVEDVNWLLKHPNVQGVILCPVDTHVSQKLVQKCQEHGVICIAADESVPGTLSIRSSNREGGQRAAEILTSVLPQKSLVGVVVDRTVKVMGRRLEGFRPQAKRAGIDIVEIFCDVSNQEHLPDYIVSGLEANPDIKGLFLTNENITTAYLTLLNQRALPLSNLVVVGYDETPLTENAIRNGTLAGAIFQHPDEIGKQAFTYLYRLLKKELHVEELTEQTIYIPTVKVTKDTLPIR